MPELPEVETIKNDLVSAGLCARTIQSADIFWHRTLAVPSLKEFQKQIVGTKIVNISRRGKYLIFELFSRGSWPAARGAAFLILHLRMSGKIDLKPADFAPRKHDRARLVFSSSAEGRMRPLAQKSGSASGGENGTQLLFHDTRKFGRWYFVDDAEKIVGKLGIEPLDAKFTAAWLIENLKDKKRTLKPLLLDQTLIAGIGNIYADEALWYAQLNPTINSSRLRPNEVKALHAGIVKAISLGVRNAGTSMGVGKANFYSVSGKRGSNQEALKVFRRTGEPCPRCHAKIERIVVGQRSTHFCPKCQGDSKPKT